MWTRLGLWLRGVMRRGDFEREMEAELRTHIECRVEDLMRSGLPQTEALRRARLEFGGLEGCKESCREARGLRLIDELRGDLRYAWRGLGARPGLALVAIVTLGLAIGSNTALFSFLNAFVLRPIAVADPGRHVQVVGRTSRVDRDNWSYADYTGLRTDNPAFQELYATTTALVTLEGSQAPTVRVNLVTGNFLPLFTRAIAIGRALTPADDLPQQSATPIVVAHDTWRRLFGAERGTVGRRLRLNNADFVIVGVSAAGFTGNEPIAADFWAPLSASTAILPERRLLADNGPARFTVAGLLKPGVSIEQGRAALSSRLARLNARLAADSVLQELSPAPWRTVFRVNGDTFQALTVLFSVFGLILLIACANLASLLLARATERQHEMALRLVLGAGRGRLIRQLLTESIVLASLGAMLGLALTYVANSAIQSYLFDALLRLGLSFQPLAVDRHAFLLAAGLALVAGLAFGILPALACTDAGLVTSLRPANPGSSGLPRYRRVRAGLVVGEVAASVVLLAAAGILFRSAQGMSHVQHGYDLDRVVDVRLTGSKPELLRRIAENAQFVAASEAWRTPLVGRLPQMTGKTDGRAHSLGYNLVDGRHFATLGMPLRRGRTFAPDEERAQAAVAIVSETTARRLWPAADPLGQALEVPEAKPGERVRVGRYRVIGVVGDVINGRLDEGLESSAVYLPATPGDARNGLLIRFNGEASRFVGSLKRTCLGLDRYSSCEPTLLSERAWLQRLPVLIVRDISAAIASLALGLTSIGLCGIVGYSAARRRREIGVRMALGAPRATLLASLLREATRYLTLGVLIGIPLCLAFSWVTLSFAHAAHLPVFDPVAYAVTLALVVTMVLGACYVPARRAMGVDPMIVLREE